MSIVNGRVRFNDGCKHAAFTSDILPIDKFEQMWIIHWRSFYIAFGEMLGEFHLNFFLIFFYPLFQLQNNCPTYQMLQSERECRFLASIEMNMQKKCFRCNESDPQLIVAFGVFSKKKSIVNIRTVFAIDVVCRGAQSTFCSIFSSYLNDCIALGPHLADGSNVFDWCRRDRATHSAIVTISFWNGFVACRAKWGTLSV